MSPEDELPCVFQIPLTYGDTRRPLEAETLLRIQQALLRQFGGFTPLGTIEGGSWFDESEGVEVRDDQLRIEVWVPRSQVSVFRQLVRRVGFETRQRQMFVIIPDARVDRLEIQDSDAVGLAL